VSVAQSIHEPRLCILLFFLILVSFFSPLGNIFNWHLYLIFDRVLWKMCWTEALKFSCVMVL